MTDCLTDRGKKLAEHETLEVDGVQLATFIAAARNGNFRHVTLGHSNKEIALRLGISHQTVKKSYDGCIANCKLMIAHRLLCMPARSGWVRLDGR